MLTVKVGKVLYEVFFEEEKEVNATKVLSYYYPEDAVRAMVSYRGDERNITTCIVQGYIDRGNGINKDAPVDYHSEGTAIRRPDEPSVKALGRKIALTRVLKNFRENIRTIIWKEYWKATLSESQNRGNLLETLKAMFIDETASIRTKKAASALLETRDDMWLKTLRGANLDNSPTCSSTANEAAITFCISFLEEQGFEVIIREPGGDYD